MATPNKKTKKAMKAKTYSLKDWNKLNELDWAQRAIIGLGILALAMWLDMWK